MFTLRNWAPCCSPGYKVPCWLSCGSLPGPCGSGFKRRGLPMPSWPVTPGLCLLCFLVSGQVVLLLFSDGMVQGVSSSGDREQLVLSGGGTHQHFQHAILMLQSI
ncbi:hypothetical protein CapIbe_006918 [Capra ibex]